MFKFARFASRSSALQYTPLRYKSAFNKVFNSIEEALFDMKSNSTVLVGGFGLCGVPENLLEGVRKRPEIRDITLVSNNFGLDGYGPGVLLKTGQVKRVKLSYFGDNKEIERQYLNGEVEVEFVPQGTLAEKCRAGGAGIPAFYTPTGVGTAVQYGGFPIKFKRGTQEPEILSEPRKSEFFNGREYLLEPSLTGDFAFIKAYKADKKGNLTFSKTARNMNPDFATAAKVVIAEVEEIVEEGELHPDEIHIPSVYVHRVVKGEKYLKTIEKLMHDNSDGTSTVTEAQKKRNRIAERAARKIANGSYINLGVGLPTLIPNFLPKGVEVELQSENGVLGVGRYPRPGQEDPDLVNAGKETITVNKGASYFSSSQSFGIIRGRHLDWTVLGGMEVSSTGDLANWVIPGKKVKGMGGAMDLVGSGTRVMICMEHNSKAGGLKIKDKCDLPLTGKGVVSVVVTDKATFEFIDGKMTLTDIEEGLTLEDIKKCTGGEYKVADHLLTRRAATARKTESVSQSASL